MKLSGYNKIIDEIIKAFENTLKYNENEDQWYICDNYHTVCLSKEDDEYCDYDTYYTIYEHGIAHWIPISGELAINEIAPHIRANAPLTLDDNRTLIDIWNEIVL